SRHIIATNTELLDDFARRRGFRAKGHARALEDLVVPLSAPNLAGNVGHAGRIRAGELIRRRGRTRFRPIEGTAIVEVAAQGLRRVRKAAGISAVVVQEAEVLVG